MEARAQLMSAEPAPEKLSFKGQGGTLFGIFIVNLLLSVVTLGVYSFWGKAKMRRYIYGQTEVFGERFMWHGTGKELFFGALKAFGLFVVFYGLFFALQRFVSPIAAMIWFYVGIIAVVPFALWGSMRYRLSRTSWRGIRFSFRGELGECMKIFVGGTLLTILTLGIWSPWFRARQRSYFTRNTYFGNAPFAYDGEGRALLGSFLLSLLLTVPTLYFVWLWFLAKQHRYEWSHTTFAGARFASTMTGWDTFVLLLANGLLAIVTLGLGFPWIIVRNIRFMLERIELHGSPGLEKIVQDPAVLRGGSMGEGIADALDIGSAIG